MTDQRRMILLPSPLAPMVNDGEINQSRIAAVILRNAGTATVELWNGLYTLDPKETLSLNVTEWNAELDLATIPVRFNTGTGGVKRLEIILLKATYC